jgi:hypothetical protein
LFTFGSEACFKPGQDGFVVFVPLDLPV